MIESNIAVTVPNGWWVDGVRSSEVVLRPLSGFEEVYFVETGAALLPPSRTTALLARCIVWMDSSGPVTPEAVRNLIAGDREALVLHLLRISCGEPLPMILRCARTECRELLDVDLKVRDLILPPYPQALPWYERTFAEDSAAYQVRFRLVQGADLEAAARRAPIDLDGATELVLRRCVASIAPEGVPDVRLETVPEVVRRELPEVMGELDPQAAMTLRLVCPACGQPFSSNFDPSTYLFEAAIQRAPALFREVHVLASWYHWTEAEILAMTRARRRCYVELVAGALSEAHRN